MVIVDVLVFWLRRICLLLRRTTRTSGYGVGDHCVHRIRAVGSCMVDNSA
jgi:hypothetical protein